jgi:hypothetical protein
MRWYDLILLPPSQVRWDYGIPYNQTLKLQRSTHCETELKKTMVRLAKVLFIHFSVASQIRLLLKTRNYAKQVFVHN